MCGSFKQHSKETGPHPSPRLTNCSRSFSYFSCNKPLCESTRDVFEKQTQEISMSYVLKLKTCPDNPAYSCVFEPPNSKLFENLAWLHLLASEFYHCLRIQRLAWMWLMTSQCQIPPWSRSEPQICLSLTKYKKYTTNPEVYKQAFLKITIMRCFNCNKFGQQSNVVEQQQSANDVGKINTKKSVRDPWYAQIAKVLMLFLPKIARSGRRRRRFNAFALKNASLSLKPDSTHSRWKTHLLPWSQTVGRGNVPFEWFHCSCIICWRGQQEKNGQICGLSDRSHLGFFGHSSADCPFCFTCSWRSRIGICLLYTSDAADD